jgi:hypothetical protein
VLSCWGVRKIWRENGGESRNYFCMSRRTTLLQCGCTLLQASSAQMNRKLAQCIWIGMHKVPEHHTLLYYTSQQSVGFSTQVDCYTTAFKRQLTALKQCTYAPLRIQNSTHQGMCKRSLSLFACLHTMICACARLRKTQTKHLEDAVNL